MSLAKNDCSTSSDFRLVTGRRRPSRGPVRILLRHAMFLNFHPILDIELAWSWVIDLCSGPTKRFLFSVSNTYFIFLVFFSLSLSLSSSSSSPLAGWLCDRHTYGRNEWLIGWLDGKSIWSLDGWMVHWCFGSIDRSIMQSVDLWWIFCWFRHLLVGRLQRHTAHAETFNPGPKFIIFFSLVVGYNTCILWHQNV